jgi:DNA-directed RNA polymerase subunit K/omega
MDQLKKENLLKYAKNEYLGSMLAARVARRLHAMHPDQRPAGDEEKMTSLALRLITDGVVTYQINKPVDDAIEDLDEE